MKDSDISRPLYEVDPQISNAIDNEAHRQHEGLELIALETLAANLRLSSFLHRVSAFIFNDIDITRFILIYHG